MNLDSAEHSDAFERARADYERCVEFLSPIADRARNELRDCRRYVRTLTDAIEARARELQREQ